VSASHATRLSNPEGRPAIIITGRGRGFLALGADMSNHLHADIQDDTRRRQPRRPQRASHALRHGSSKRSYELAWVRLSLCLPPKPIIASRSKRPMRPGIGLVSFPDFAVPALHDLTIREVHGTAFFPKTRP